MWTSSQWAGPDSLDVCLPQRVRLYGEAVASLAE
jgi:hypothetical protein